MNKYYLILIFLFSVNSFGYVITKSLSGNDIKWTRAHKDIELKTDLRPKHGNVILDITEAELAATGLPRLDYIEKRSIEILNESLSEWTAIVPYRVQPAYGLHSLKCSQFRNNSSLYR